MKTISSVSAEPESAHIHNAVKSCLLLDLEVNPAGKILKIAAVLDGQQFSRSCSLPHVLRDLEDFSRRADVIAGHNIVQHDLPFLKSIAPHHPLFNLPAIDTLLLSPICFPENPYHPLVKDYKLVSESVNDPVADAKLAGTLLDEEVAALAALKTTQPDAFALTRF